MFTLAIIALVLAIMAGFVRFVVSEGAKREAAAAAKLEAKKAGQQAEAQRSRGYYDDHKDEQPDSTLTEVRPYVTGAVVVLIVLTAAFAFFSSFVTVSTRNVGVVTSYGRPVASLDNGPHFIAPWESVTELPETIQTDGHVKGEPLGCVTVRIAYQIVACADISIRWRIQPSAADSLFQNYQDFSNIRDSLVSRELAAASNAVFQDYDPMSFDSNGNSTAPALSALATQVTKQMRTAIGSQIDVISVFASVLHYDPSTQSRINALQAQVAQTRIAIQAEKTAQAQATANQILSASVSNAPNVLVSKCLDTLDQMVNKGQAIPPGFSCWPSSGSAVVVPATGR